MSGKIVYWNVLTGVLLQTFFIRLTKCLDFALGKIYESTTSILAGYDDGGARLFFCNISNYQRLLPHEFSVKKVFFFNLILNFFFFWVAIYSSFGATVTAKELVLRIWDLETGNIVCSMQKQDSECMFLNFYDSNKICAITEIGTIYIYEIATASILIEKKIFDINLLTTPIKKRRELNSINGQTLLTLSFSDNSIICGIYLNKIFYFFFYCKFK